MTKRLLLTALLALGVGGLTACDANNNCVVRMDCEVRVIIVYPDGGREIMTTLEAEVRGLDIYIERPAADTMASCEEGEENLDRSAC